MSKHTNPVTHTKPTKHTATLIKPAAPKPQTPAEPKLEAAPTPKVRKERETMTKHARIAIREGKTRDQVWELLKTDWKLPVEKKWYVNWYFAEAKRAGIDIGTSKLSAEPTEAEVAA